MAAMATIMKPLANLGVLPTWSCKQRGIHPSPRRQLRFVVRAQADESLVGQTPAAPIEPEAGSLATDVKKPEEPEVATPGQTPVSPIASEEPASEVRKPSPLKEGDEGKAGLSAKFDDPRWRAGTWDITKFTRDGKIDWDAVIDAEVTRRKWLEENPEASDNTEPVVFDTGTVPWWAWVKRFHLPEAELLNGRAAMVGYGMGYLVDSATGAGLVDQQSSFLGKLLLLLTVLGVLLIRNNSDVQNLRTIAKESTFYDKQWQATWKDDENKDDENKDDEKPSAP